VKRQNLLL